MASRSFARSNDKVSDLHLGATFEKPVTFRTAVPYHKHLPCSETFRDKTTNAEDTVQITGTTPGKDRNHKKKISPIKRQKNGRRQRRWRKVLEG
ncbi:hypothetical protein JTE90_019185 [Oedothorax gibbosus]|uniref:Uncharacterized protein n=1 Tax=Oedothorax gibbosus TaxID=931172 RepID=A0AAV6U610_9ARAC|nr:hypothetical protein JTE90_019185 [Oedothorax gibbosus]